MEPKDTFIAHIKTDSNSNKIIQTCSNHLENSAKYSADALKDLDLCSTGYFAGLHHDILDQNSKIIRDCIDDDSIILEHHSNEGIVSVLSNKIISVKKEHLLKAHSGIDASFVILTFLIDEGIRKNNKQKSLATLSHIARLMLY